jgi:tetratricopeptide (TPR) repeat protein
MTDSPLGLLTPHPPRRRSRWLMLLLFVSAAAIGGGFYWNSLRPQNCYRRGREALRAGDRETAMRESQRLVEIPGFSGQGHLLAGFVLMREGRADKALPELLKAAESEATAVEALTALAECYYISGLFPEATNAAASALKWDPEALDARRWLAAAYYDLGATISAADELEIVSAKAPDDARSERLLGLIGKDTENFGKAVEHYRESLRRNPDQPDRGEIQLELAESLVKLSRFDEALETLGECDRTAAVLTLKAECEQNLGRPDEALRQLQEALQLDPEYVPAYLRRGTLLLSLGHPKEAIAPLLEAIRLAPEISQPHFQLAQAYGRLGERERADRQLKLVQETQAIEREFTQLHETASENPNDADVRYRIGVLAGKLRRPELAQLWFRAALALEPGHAQARAALENAVIPAGKARIKTTP